MTYSLFDSAIHTLTPPALISLAAALVVVVRSVCKETKELVHSLILSGCDFAYFFLQFYIRLRFFLTVLVLSGWCFFSIYIWIFSQVLENEIHSFVELQTRFFFSHSISLSTVWYNFLDPCALGLNSFIFFFLLSIHFQATEREQQKKTKKNRTWAMWWRILNRFAETIVPKLSWCLHVRVLMLPQILRIQFIIQTHREIIMIKKRETNRKKRRCISKWDDAPCSPVHHHSNWCTRGNDQPNERTQAKQQTTTLCTSL